MLSSTSASNYSQRATDTHPASCRCCIHSKICIHSKDLSVLCSSRKHASTPLSVKENNNIIWPRFDLWYNFVCVDSTPPPPCCIDSIPSVLASASMVLNTCCTKGTKRYTGVRTPVRTCSSYQQPHRHKALIIYSNDMIPSELATHPVHVHVRRYLRRLAS